MRIVAIVISVLVAAGAGYAIGAATDDETAPPDPGMQAPEQSQHPQPLETKPDPSAAAAEEYELTP